MRKYLAIDPGGKRSGLATGDDLTGQVGPVGVIETSDRDELVRQIVAAVEEHADEPDGVDAQAEEGASRRAGRGRDPA
jgi:RNase H-fold protein (predicted Holliday junction resolvase)